MPQLKSTCWEPGFQAWAQSTCPELSAQGLVPLRWGCALPSPNVSKGHRDHRFAFQTHPGSQASCRREAKDSTLLSSRDRYLLEPTEWPKGSQAPCGVWSPFGFRGGAGDCARVTAGQKRPNLGLCPGPNVPLQGPQGSQVCIPDSPRESGLVSKGSKGLRSPFES